jgi:hypothetical protein
MSSQTDHQKRPKSVYNGGSIVPVLQHTRAWIKQHPIAATGPLLLLHRFCRYRHANIRWWKFKYRIGNDRPDRTGYIGLEGNRPAETEINQADRQGGPGKHGVEQAGGHRSWQAR